jgi:hypothetical protein
VVVAELVQQAPQRRSPAASLTSRRTSVTAFKEKEGEQRSNVSLSTML